MIETPQGASNRELRAKVEGIIVQLMRDLLASQGTAVEALDSTTVLFGREGYLDSLGLVSLVVSTEQALQDELNLTVSLADDKALSQRQSPFRTVGSLADYAVSSL